MTSILGITTGVAVAVVLGLKTSASLYGIASGLLIGEGISFIGLLWRWFNKIKPDAISAVNANPENAEPKTWGLYFYGFFKSCSYVKREVPLLPAINLGNNNV